MFKKIISTLVVSAFVAMPTTQSAQARGGFAKDIVEEGYWNAGVIGGSVHVYKSLANYPHAIVVDWNPDEQVVEVRYDDGSLQWVWAGNVYSEAQTKEAQQDEAIGAVGIGAIVCAFLCGSDHHSQPSSPSNEDNDNSSRDDPARDQQQQDNTNHQAYCPGDPQGPLGHPCPN
jgi:hypothetical protein